MPRSSPSAADRALIEALAREDVEVSHAQLERWRTRGLLPRATITKARARGSSAQPHPSAVYRAAARLAAESGRGVPWQWGAFALVDADLPLSTAALRAAAVWWVERPLKPARRIWAEAVAGLPPTFALEESTLPALSRLVAQLAAEHRTFRYSLSLVRRELDGLQHFAPEDDPALAAQTALALRLAAMQGTRLTPALRARARYGVPHRPRGPLQMSLWDEQWACARTLTRDEVQRVSFLFDLLDQDGALPEALPPALHLSIVETTLRRLNTPPAYDAGTPLSVEQLGDWDEELAELEADLADGPPPGEGERTVGEPHLAPTPQ